MDTRNFMEHERRTSSLARVAFRCVLALALCLALAAGFLPGARAGGTPNITVVFPSQEEDGTVLALYKVGVWLDDGQIHLLSQYQDVTVPETMSADLAHKLAQDLLGVASANEPDPTTKTVANGQAEFTVEPGAYLVAKHSGADSLGFEPLMLIVDKESLTVSAKVSEVVTAEVEKKWEGEPTEYDMTDVRPESIKVTLYADGTPYCREGKTDPVTAELKDTGDPETSWRASVGDLPKYKADGAEIREINYSWVEEEVPVGYHQAEGSPVTAQDGGVFKTTITNEMDAVEASVSKVWKDDNENADSTRPEIIEVSLKEGDKLVKTVTLPGEDGKWTATISGLPAYRNGAEIKYHWVEENVPAGYAVSYDDASAKDVTITNTLSDNTSATVRKDWDDADNQDGMRPGSITVKLMRSVNDGEPEFVQSVTLNKENDWQATIENLAKYYKADAEYQYTWQEDRVDGYQEPVIKPDGTVTTITNPHVPETTEVTIIKEWEDFDNRYGLRPREIKVPLSDGGEDIIQYVTLNKDNNWQATVGGLPKYRNGELITYTFVAKELDDSGYLDAYYKLKVNHEEGSTVTTFVNTLQPRKRIPVVKYWQDGRTDAERPPITIQLMNGSKVVAEKVLTKSPWEYVFDNLDALDEKGNEIEYTVKEIVPKGYTASIATIDTTLDGEPVTTFVITNTPIHTPPDYNNYEGVKVWNDGGNAAGIRPAYITVHLLRDGVEVASATVTAATNWQYHFDNMPVDDGYGHVYTYTVVEDGVPGYYTVVKGSTIINGIIPDEPNPPKTEEELEKVVDLFNHDTPLFDRPLGTGDELPIYPFVFAGIGLAAVVLLLVLGRRRRRS